MILVIDNYDSFTYNLVQMLEVRESEVRVERNDALSAREIVARKPRGVVFSPGPGRPEDAGVCMPLLALRPGFPIFGVCLGHQAIGAAFGATVDRAPRLVHGKTSRVRHDDRGLFSGLANPFEATRYHSLEVQESSLPAELEPLAWAEDGTLMGLRHRELPYSGVQFHPESILTEEGGRILDNFLEICRAEETRR